MNTNAIPETTKPKQVSRLFYPTYRIFPNTLVRMFQAGMPQIIDFVMFSST